MRLLIALVLCASPLAAANLITNGTFDNNCAGWSFGGFVNFCDTGGGNPAPALVLNDFPGPVPLATQTIAGLVSGTTYQISLDALTFFNCCNDNAIPGAGVAIDGHQFEFLVVDGQPWTTYTFNFTYGGGSNVLVLSSQRNGTDSDAEFDNVSLTPAGSAVPEPSSLVLMGAIAVMVWGRRLSRARV